jgi:F-type H+-transporting ATPase subunit gamma
MASLRDIRTRIGSVKNTKQITSAMKMVSAAKLKRATDAATRARPYQQTLQATLRRVAAASASAGGEVTHPLLTARERVERVLVVVVTSDRGLCGGFNANLNRKTLDFIQKLRAEGKQVEVRTYGKKSRDFFKSRYPAIQSTVELTGPKFSGEAGALSDTLAHVFTAGTYDEVWIAYNQFKNTLTQTPSFSRVLPLSIDASGGDGVEYVYEPSGPEMLAALLPLALRTQLLQAFLETEAGEHAARMTAMDNATRNASDLIAALTLEYNRGRQAAITKELIEIVSGAEAL